jgi:glycosyltransferase involved in cell wall biosynthesis
MESEICISIIIPVYNRQVLSERALRSVEIQNVGGMEIVVVDDCSSPPFRLPDDLNRPHINVVRLEQNQGDAGARNAGVVAARGDWIAFLDSDDYWLPGTLAPRLSEAKRSFADSNDPLTIYVGGFVVQRPGRCEARMPVGSNNPTMFASGCWFSPGSTSLMRRDVFTNIGPYDSALRRLGDLDWHLRLALSGGRVAVWEELVAVIQPAPKSMAALEIAISHLQTKYASTSGSFQLAPNLLRRLAAYFDIERASVMAAEQNWLLTAFFLMRSLARVPRLTVHLERFWRGNPIKVSSILPLGSLCPTAL